MKEYLIFILGSMAFLMIGALGKSQDFTILAFWFLAVVLIEVLTDINKTLKSK
jgi:hypothetical protein